VAIIGAGGIGFDVGEFLTHHGGHDETEEYCAEWGIDMEFRDRGGLGAIDERPAPRRSGCCREIEQGRRRTGEDHRLDPPYAPQEARSHHGSGRRVRGSTTPGFGSASAGGRRSSMSTPSSSAPAEPRRELLDPLRQAGRPVTLIGGADIAAELDARRAIAQGTEVALGL
jgi:2,4-dienoyl-CoA reductase (NADPH2)